VGVGVGVGVGVAVGVAMGVDEPPPEPEQAMNAPPRQEMNVQSSRGLKRMEILFKRKRG
jgi:hypothetical protein